MAEKITFEQALSRLDDISTRLGQGDTPLEEAVDLYAEAAKLIALCNKKLNSAQTKLQKVMLTEEEPS